jgi:hypothetical protein
LPRRTSLKGTAVSKDSKRTPEPEWHASWYGTQIYFNPSVLPGTIQLYDKSGNLLGTFYDVAKIELSGRY